MKPETKNLIYRSIFAYKKASEAERINMLKILIDKIEIWEYCKDEEHSIAGKVFLRIHKNL